MTELKRGRKALPKEEKLVRRSISVRPDQLKWLNSKPNPSQTVRDAIDNEMFIEKYSDGVIAQSTGDEIP